MAMEDDITAQRLLELARALSKLALEHFGKTLVQNANKLYELKLSI